MLTRSTVNQIVRRVGDKLDIDPATGLPNEAQIKQWLQDGCLRMAELMPADMLGSMLSTTGITRSGSVYDSFGVGNIAGGEKWAWAQVLRPLGYTLYDEAVDPSNTTVRGNSCLYMPYDEFLAATARGPALWGSNFPAVTMVPIGVALPALVVYPYPAIAKKLWLTYVHMPAPIAEWDTSPLWVPPATWEESLVDYAVIQAKTQDEESEQVQALVKDWQTSMMMKVAGRIAVKRKPSVRRRETKQQEAN